MKKIFILFFILLFLVSCNFGEKNQPQDEKKMIQDEEQTIQDTKNESSELTSKYNFNGGGEEPFWNFTLNGNDFAFFSPNGNTTYNIEELEENGENFIFSGENISGKLLKKECIDGGIGNTHAYTINLTTEEDMIFEGCADITKISSSNVGEKVDLVDGQTGNIRELEALIGEDIVDQPYKDIYNYTANEEGKYFLVDIASKYGSWSIAIIKEGNSYKEIWNGMDVLYEDCEKIYNEYPEVYNQETGLFANCENIFIDVKIDDLSKEQKCEYGYIKKIIYTSPDTVPYINALEKAVEESKEEGFGLIKYNFKQIDLEKGDGFYFAIVEIHKDSEDSPERELINRRYKVDIGGEFFEYDVITDSYIHLNVLEKFLEDYENNCPKG